MTEKTYRHATWAELHHEYFMAQPGFAEAVQQTCMFDWSAIPVAPAPSEPTPSSVAVAAAQRGAFELIDGRRVFWESLQQRNLHVALTFTPGRTYHPFDRVRRALNDMTAMWPGSARHRIVLPPMRLNSRRILITIGNERVDGVLARLPPIECMGILRGEAHYPGEHDSFVAVLWYQEGFGIDPDVTELIRVLDWPRYAGPLRSLR
ncbi:MAG: hypothetical protein ACK4E7_05295 [Permianibacter sp.]